VTRKERRKRVLLELHLKNQYVSVQVERRLTRGRSGKRRRKENGKRRERSDKRRGKEKEDTSLSIHLNNQILCGLPRSKREHDHSVHP
jgi:hypothetical protein